MMNSMMFAAMIVAHGPKLGQEPAEWRMFMEFLYSYFKSRQVERPIVVEIGTMNDVQKFFYAGLLNARHIGIDIAGNADIVGRSQATSTVKALKDRLAGREIDLLFIDGDHTYASVKADYEIYGPLTKHIIALHDISHPYSASIPEETMRLWKEIVASEKSAVLLSIRKHNAMTSGLYAGRQMGIGLVVKGE